MGKKSYLRATDGDTPYISMSIRMLCLDTPEVHYPGVQKPSKQDANLANWHLGSNREKRRYNAVWVTIYIRNWLQEKLGHFKNNLCED
ncbi:hypothetical protein E3J74_09175 [Candidatus Bathyarchaeota archaeon]|nr:MAG: hypothetical protein E3J74_09175 [Candidatus Bathyarchaeota archaeon]